MNVSKFDECLGRWVQWNYGLHIKRSFKSVQIFRFNQKLAFLLFGRLLLSSLFQQTSFRLLFFGWSENSDEQMHSNNEKKTQNLWKNKRIQTDEAEEIKREQNERGKERAVKKQSGVGGVKLCWAKNVQSVVHMYVYTSDCLCEIVRCGRVLWPMPLFFFLFF